MTGVQTCALPISIILAFTSCGINIEKKPSSVRGGIHGWADALNLMRNPWKGFRYSTIHLNNRKLNISFIPKYFIKDNLDYNVTDMINDMFTSFTDDKEEGNTDKMLLEGKEYHKVIKEYVAPLCTDDSTGNVKFVCDKFGDLGLESYGFTEENLEETSGFVFSSVVILTMIAVFFVVSLLFMISGFCICCCCCPKKSTSPNVLSIVIFILGAVAMVFGGVTIIVSLLSTGNAFSAVKDLPDTINEISNDFYKMVESTESSITKNVTPEYRKVNKTIDALVNNATEIFKDVRKSIDTTLNYLEYNNDSVFQLLDSLEDMTNEYTNYINKIIKYRASCSEIEKENIINEVNTVKDYSNDINNYTNNKDNFINYKKQIEDYMNKPKEISDNINSSLSSVDDFMQNPDISFKKDIKEFADKWNENGQSYIDYHDTVDTFSKYFKYYPVLCIPGVVCIIITAIYIASFFTKCCCSRCVACYSFCNQFTCNVLLFIFGILTTLLCFFIVMISRAVVYTFDDSFNYAIDTVVPDRHLAIPDLDISSTTENMISDKIHFNDVVFSNEHFEVVDNLLKSKISDSLDNILLITKVLPIESLAESLQSGVSKANVKIPQSLTEAVNKAKTELKNLPESFNEVINIDTSIDKKVEETKKTINDIVVSDTNTQCGFSQAEANNLTKKINDIGVILNKISNSYNNAIDTITNSLLVLLDKTPENLEKVVQWFIIKIADVIKSIILSLRPTIQGISGKAVVKTLNLCRSGALIPFANLSTFFSIGAHFFMIGIFVCSILLTIRRRGMRQDIDSDGSSSEQSTASIESYSGAQTIDIISIRNDKRLNSLSSESEFSKSEFSNQYSGDEEQIQSNNNQSQINNNTYATSNPYQINNNSVYPTENPYQSYQNSSNNSEESGF